MATKTQSVAVGSLSAGDVLVRDSGSMGYSYWRVDDDAETATEDVPFSPRTKTVAALFEQGATRISQQAYELFEKRLFSGRFTPHPGQEAECLHGKTGVVEEIVVDDDRLLFKGTRSDGGPWQSRNPQNPKTDN